MLKFPKKKYKLIYADPPWEYRNKKTGGTNMISSAESKYKTLSIDELCKLPIQKISDKDSVLFLWTTTPLLPEGLKVMESWGFKYKTSIYWRKIMSLGMGFWFRGQVELCLMGIKGNVKAFRIQKENFIQSQVRLHSKKPDEMYNLLELTKLEPKIELFTRQRWMDWDHWGNELSPYIQTNLKVKK